MSTPIEEEDVEEDVPKENNGRDMHQEVEEEDERTTRRGVPETHHQGGDEDYFVEEDPLAPGVAQDHIPEFNNGRSHEGSEEYIFPTESTTTSIYDDSFSEETNEDSHENTDENSDDYSDIDISEGGSDTDTTREHSAGEESEGEFSSSTVELH